MQNFRNSVWSVWSKVRGSVYKTMKTTRNMLHLKVSSASERIKRYFDPMLVAYFDQRKFIQGKLDRLSNHSSTGYATVVMLNLAAIILKSAVAVECVHHFRPYYWMIMKFFIYLLYFMGRKTTTIFLVMIAIMKFFVITIFQLTSAILVGLTRLVDGVFHVTKILITPVTSSGVVFRKDWKFILQFCFLCCVIVTLILLWRRRVVSPGVTSSSEGKQQMSDSVRVD